MKLLPILFFILPLSLFAQEDSLAKDTTILRASTGSKKAKIEKAPTKNAEFPGGFTEMSKFISKNLKYPQSARDKGIQGKVYARFIVGKDGMIEKVMIVKGIDGCEACSDEVIRVIKLMPKWKPARVGGKKVRSFFDLPVKFTLN